MNPKNVKNDEYVELVLPGLIDEKLSVIAFQNFAGSMAGYAFVKVVLDRSTGKVHFINHHHFSFHVDYVAECILKKPRSEVRADIDSFNQKNYLQENRDFFLGIVSLQNNGKNEKFFALETVEIDNANGEMILEFFNSVKSLLDSSIPSVFKPANHMQETTVQQMDQSVLPRIFNHELFASKKFVPLNAGKARGRIRFMTENNYSTLRSSLTWYDIIVMEKVPEDIPRISGIINAAPTTPLSHTNVLACGWQIPNAIDQTIQKRITESELDGKWVEYSVSMDDSEIDLQEIEALTDDQLQRPSWKIHQIKLDQPDIENRKIKSLNDLRKHDHSVYGTKAANIGELHNILQNGSMRLAGFYRVPRPPRENLTSYLMKILKCKAEDELEHWAAEFIRKSVKVPRGIALPFSLQREFLESSPQIQQLIGKIKMALELKAKEVDPLCLKLQGLIKSHRLSEKFRSEIDGLITKNLSGVSSFVIRSSSNAEDLANFSAAGIYESTNHVTNSDCIFESIKTVWASLISPRSVRLRSEVGISLDDSYMGVIIQEEVSSDMGGVLVTTNPMNAHDFRNVFINASQKSAIEIVEGRVSPHQYLFNTLEGGGRTLSIGDSTSDLSSEKKDLLQTLAYNGRLLQSHFSPNYLFNEPMDIEWAANGNDLFILQIRPYSF